MTRYPFVYLSWNDPKTILYSIMLQCHYPKSEFQKSNSPKQFWKTVKKFQGKSEKTSIGTMKSTNGDQITDDYGKANELNRFFASVGRTLAANIDAGEPNLNSHFYRVTPTASKIFYKLRWFLKSLYVSC